jgi:hypothetical protein
VNEFALPHQDIAELLEKVQEPPQPVLTRWWCVGVAAAFPKQNYRIVLRATQTCANSNNADSKPNKIACGSQQSLMKQDIACSDMLFWLNFMKIGSPTTSNGSKQWMMLRRNPAFGRVKS